MNELNELSKEDAIRMLRHIYKYVQQRQRLPRGAEQTAYDTRYIDGGNEVRDYIREYIELSIIQPEL